MSSCMMTAFDYCNAPFEINRNNMFSIAYVVDLKRCMIRYKELNKYSYLDFRLNV